MKDERLREARESQDRRLNQAANQPFLVSPDVFLSTQLIYLMAPHDFVCCFLLCVTPFSVAQHLQCYFLADHRGDWQFGKSL